MKRLGTFVLWLAVVVVATAALISAVLMPEESWPWLRDLTGLGSGDETAATPWVRWALIVTVVTVLLFARLWGQTGWVDVVAIAVVFLVAFATFKQHREAEKATVTEEPETATFTLPEEKLVVERDLAARSKAIVVIVEPATEADKKPLTYSAARYSVTVPAKVKGGPGEASVDIAVERGEKDANAVAFSADLTGATMIYLLPGPNEK